MSEEEIRQILNIINAIEHGPMHWTTYAGLVLGLLGLLSVLIGVQQVRLLRRQLSYNHDRASRIEVINAVRKHSELVKPEYNKAKDIFESLSPTELEKLYDQNSDFCLKVSNRHISVICSVLESRFPDIRERYIGNENEVELTRAETLQLRFIMIEFLNYIEICLLPWYLKVARRDLMEEQFRALVQPLENDRTSKPRLQEARSVVGEDKFPATISFINTVFKERKSDIDDLRP